MDQGVLGRKRSAISGENGRDEARQHSWH